MLMVFPSSILHRQDDISLGVEQHQVVTQAIEEPAAHTGLSTQARSRTTGHQLEAGRPEAHPIVGLHLREGREESCEVLHDILEALCPAALGAEVALRPAMDTSLWSGPMISQGPRSPSAPIRAG